MIFTETIIHLNVDGSGGLTSANTVEPLHSGHLKDRGKWPTCVEVAVVDECMDSPPGPKKVTVVERWPL